MHAIAVQALAPALESTRTGAGSAVAETGSFASALPLRALDIGSGSGYVAAVLSVMLFRAQQLTRGAEQQGSAASEPPAVLAVELDSELAAQSVDNLAHAKIRLRETGGSGAGASDNTSLGSVRCACDICVFSQYLF